MKERIEDGRTLLESPGDKEASEDFIRGMIRAYREILDFEPEYEGEQEDDTSGL